MSEPERERRSEDSAAFESEKARRVANVERNRSLTTAERGDLIRILSDLTYAEAVRIKDRALDLAMSGSSRAGGLTAAEDAEQGRIRRIQRIYELTGEQGLNDKDQNELKGLLRDEKRNQTPIRDSGFAQPARRSSAGSISGGQDVKTTVTQSLPGLPHSLGKC